MSTFERRQFITRDIMNTRDIPGAQPSRHSRVSNNRNPLSVEDISGAIPSRLVGYTGARPDTILMKSILKHEYGN